MSTRGGGGGEGRRGQGLKSVQLDTKLGSATKCCSRKPHLLRCLMCPGSWMGKGHSSGAVSVPDGLKVSGSFPSLSRLKGSQEERDVKVSDFTRTWKSHCQFEVIVFEQDGPVIGFRLKAASSVLCRIFHITAHLRAFPWRGLGLNLRAAACQTWTI